MLGVTSDLFPSRCSENSKLAGFRVHGGMYGVEIIAMLLRFIPSRARSDAFGGLEWE